MMLELHNIYKTYEQGKMEVPVLKNISLSVAEGEYLAIMGPSGSGKTTLMNIIGCLDTPTSGQYYLDNEELSAQNDAKLSQVRLRSIGFVFQSFHLLPRQSALENVALPLLYAGVKKKERLDIARSALERVGLGDRTDFKPTQLSGGQCQRVAIARAIVNNPKILLADEPTGALDTKSGEQIMEVFQMLNDQGVTVVMITHEPDIAAHAKRVLHIRDGRLMDAAGNYLSPVSEEPNEDAPLAEEAPLAEGTPLAGEAPLVEQAGNLAAAVTAPVEVHHAGHASPEEALDAELSALLEREIHAARPTEEQSAPAPSKEEQAAPVGPTVPNAPNGRVAGTEHKVQPIEIESILPLIEREEPEAEPMTEEPAVEAPHEEQPEPTEPTEDVPVATAAPNAPNGRVAGAEHMVQPIEIESILPLIEREEPAAEPKAEEPAVEAPREEQPVPAKPATEHKVQPIEIESILPLIEREEPAVEPQAEEPVVEAPREEKPNGPNVPNGPNGPNVPNAPIGRVAGAAEHVIPVQIPTENLFKKPQEPEKEAPSEKSIEEQPILIAKATKEGAPEQISFDVWDEPDVIDLEAIPVELIHEDAPPAEDSPAEDTPPAEERSKATLVEVSLPEKKPAPTQTSQVSQTTLATQAAPEAEAAGTSAPKKLVDIEAIIPDKDYDG